MQAAKLKTGRFELSAGAKRAVIHPLPGRFAGEAIRWELGEDDDTVYLDAVFYRGELREFDFSKAVDTEFLVGVELLDRSGAINPQSPRWAGLDSERPVGKWSIPDQPDLVLEITRLTNP